MNRETGQLEPKEREIKMAACYQLVLDRALGSYVMPPGWAIIAAGNPASEKGVHFSMPRPLRNRFVHLELKADLNDWCRWAVGAGVRPEIIAFLRFKPDMLHAADVTSHANAWPTPRSWASLSKIVAKWFEMNGEIDHVFSEVVAGVVGEGAAAEFVGFLRLFRDLPSIDQILLAPERTPVPTGAPSALIAIATALGRAINDQTISNAAKYLARMQPEFHTLAMHDAVQRDPGIAKTKAFIDFAVRFDKVLA